jgi:hypothetical protein
MKKHIEICFYLIISVTFHSCAKVENESKNELFVLKRLIDNQQEYSFKPLSYIIYKKWNDSLRAICIFPPAYGGSKVIDSITERIEIDSQKNLLKIGDLETSILLSKDSIVFGYKDTLINGYTLIRLNERTTKIDETELKNYLRGKFKVNNGRNNYLINMVNDSIAIFDGLYTRPDTCQWVLKKIDSYFFVVFNIDEIGLLVVEVCNKNQILMYEVDDEKPMIFKKTLALGYQ